MVGILFLQQGPDHWLQYPAWIAAIITALAAIFALAFTTVQIRSNYRINRANFWLELRNMFANHSEIHRKLRDLDSGEDVKKGDDSKLIAYMGLFEQCEYMLEDKLIDERTFRKLYAYRLNTILKSERARKKLAYYYDNGCFKQYKSWNIDDEGGWEGFRRLLERCNKLKLLEEPVSPKRAPKKEVNAKETASRIIADSNA